MRLQTTLSVEKLSYPIEVTEGLLLAAMQWRRRGFSKFFSTMFLDGLTKFFLKNPWLIFCIVMNCSFWIVILWLVIPNTRDHSTRLKTLLLGTKEMGNIWIWWQSYLPVQLSIFDVFNLCAELVQVQRT